MKFNNRGSAVIPLVLGLIFVLTGFAMAIGMNQQRSARAQRGFSDRLMTRHLLSASLSSAMEQIESGIISRAGGYIPSSIKSDNFVIGPATVAANVDGSDWVISVSVKNIGQPGNQVTVWHVKLDCENGLCGITDIVETRNVSSTGMSFQEEKR